MPTRQNIRRGCIFTVLLLFCGCGLFFLSPTVEVREVAIVGFDPGGLDCELYLTVTNPNSFSITLTGYNYDLHVYALPLAKGGAREDLVFKANGATDLRLPVRLPLPAVIELLKRRPDPDRIPYRLVAGLQVATPLGERVLSIDRDGIFAIPPAYRPSQWLNALQGMAQDLLLTR